MARTFKYFEKKIKEFNFDFSPFENYFWRENSNISKKRQKNSILIFPHFYFWRENSNNFAYLKKYVPAEVSPFEFEFDNNRSPGKSLGAEAMATNRSPGKSLGGGCMAIGALSI